jgi:PAS domain S-box-containing protein
MPHSRLKVPLHFLITIPFVLQVLGIVSLVGYFSYRSGEKSVEQLVDRLAIGLNENVETHLTHYLSRAQEVNQINVQAIEAGTIDLNNVEKLGQYFYYQVKEFGFDYVHFAGKDGRFLGSGYLSPSVIEIAEILPENPNYIRSYQVDETGERINLFSENYTSNLHHRSGYRQYTETIDNSKPIWSSIYTGKHSPQDISISASQVAQDFQGNVLGIFSIDLKLERINDFLKTISHSDAVLIFIVERSGTLVASSQYSPSDSVIPGQSTPLQATESKDPNISQVTKTLRRRFGSLDQIRSSQFLRPPIKAGEILTYPFIKVTPFQDAYGLDWLVITVIPETQVMTEIQSNNQRTIFLCGLALVGSIGFGIWTSRRISRSFVQLDQAIQSLTESNFKTELPTSYIQETQDLYYSFAKMAKDLQCAQELQENYQYILQREVEIKTKALTEAQTIAQMGSWEFDIITQGITWSQELYRIYEAEDQYPCVNPHLDIESIYEGDQEKYQREILDLIASEKPFDCDIRIVTKKGNLRYIQAKGCPLFDQEGKLIHYMGTVTDISDRKKLEIALQDSQKRLCEVLDTAIVGIIRLRFYCDGRMEYDYISPHCEQIFGFPRTELRSNPTLWRSRIHPEDWKTVVFPCIENVRQCKNNFYSDTIEYRFYHQDNSIVWILERCFCLWNELGNYWNVTIVDTDISTRKQLELDLKLSEQKLNSILNSVLAIITHVWIYPNSDAQHTWEIDYVSGGAESISGYTQAELRDPFLWINRIVPEDWQKLETKIFEDVFAERSGSYEYRFRRKDDQIAWVSQHNYSSWDEARQAWSLTIITMDICDRKEEEAKRRDSEQTLAEAQRIAHIGNWSFDLKTQKIYWSEELFRMFGLDPTQPEPSYLEYLEMLDYRDRITVAEKVNLAITEGIPYLIDYQAILPDGSIRFHEGRGEVQRDEQGHIIRLRGTGLDITDRKLVELELMRRTEELDRFFSVSLDLLCIANLEGYFIRLNPQWEKTLGYPLSKLAGSRFLDYVHPDDLQNTLAALDCLIQDQILSSFANRYRCSQGEYRWIEWRSVMVGDLIYAAARDITQQKHIQEHLEQAKNRAEALTLAKTEFVANMSHEIRTPLSSIITIAELLENSTLSVEQQDLVKTLSYSSATLMNIVNDILDFSKIESGKLILEKIPFSVETEIRSVLSLFEQSAQTKNLVLKSSIPLDLSHTFLGDSARFRQILLNLIGNAIKFTETGSIWIIVREKRLETTPQFDRHELLFSVQDTGIGIQPEQLEKLFRPFSQADTSISRKYGGTGLGLVISQRLVELMGGFLWVESLGKIAGNPPADWQPSINTTHVPGSTFYFTIVLESPRSVISSDSRNPQMYKTKKQQLEPLDQTFSQRNPLTILLADDNPINRKVVQFSFRKLGYLVDTVNNGKEALESLQSKEYDLVLMDMQMPEMDGLTATQLIRKMPLKQPWIIALTANVLPQDRQACFDAGMNGYETKPLTIGKIKQICQDMNLSA